MSYKNSQGNLHPNEVLWLFISNIFISQIKVMIETKILEMSECEKKKKGNGSR